MKTKKEKNGEKKGEGRMEGRKRGRQEGGSGEEGEPTGSHHPETTGRVRLL